MAAVNVATGSIENHRLHPTRNEEDFLAFIETTVTQFPEQDEIVILVDQLNTHQSESLVRWVARQISFKDDLGTKEYKGLNWKFKGFIKAKELKNLTIN